MSMITEQVKQLREHYKSCDLAGAYTTRDILKRAADTIEQLAAKVREDNVYQRAFEDIRAELIKTSKICEPEYKDAFEVAAQIISKHNPDKKRKEDKTE